MTHKTVKVKVIVCPICHCHICDYKGIKRCSNQMCGYKGDGIEDTWESYV